MYHRYTCGGQRRTWRSPLSPSAMWVLRIQLMPQFCWQVPLPTEISCWPLKFFLKICYQITFIYLEQYVSRVFILSFGVHANNMILYLVHFGHRISSWSLFPLSSLFPPFLPLYLSLCLFLPSFLSSYTTPNLSCIFPSHPHGQIVWTCKYNDIILTKIWCYQACF